MIRTFKFTAFFVLASFVSAIAQRVEIREVIKEIEFNSDFTFNYDSKTLADFVVENFEFEEYSLPEIESFFKLSPFDFSVEQNLILVLPLALEKSTICGKIFSIEDGEALPFATLQLENGRGFVSDENGIFEMEISTYKNQLCNISYVGKELKSISVESLKSCPEVQLKNVDALGQSILIRSYILHGIQEGGSFGGVDLNLNLPSNNHLMRQAGIFHAVQLIPGISSPDDSATSLNIRGGSTDHNLILWEGVPMYGQGYLYGMISPINPYSVDKITVYKSNHPASIDNRIGGVVDMKLPVEIPEKLSMSIGANMTEGHANVGLPLFDKKLGLFLSARQSMFSLFDGNNPTYSSYLSKVFNAQRILDNEVEDIDDQEPSLDFYDVNGKGIFRISNKTSLQSSFLLTNSNSTNLSTFTQLESQGVDIQSSDNRIFSNVLKYEMDANTNLALSVKNSSYKKEAEFEYSQTNSTSALLESEESNSIDDTQIELSFSKFFKTVSAQFGYVLDRKSTTVEKEQKSSQLEEISSEIKVAKTLHHLYSQATFSSGKFTLEGGNRLSLDTESRRLFSSPSVSTRWNLYDGLIYKFSAGWYHQFIKQIYRPVDADLIVEEPIWTLNTAVSDPVLRAGKLTTGLIYKKSGWLIDVEGYIHDTRGLSIENPNIRNVVSSEKDNQLVSKGLDILINKRISRFNTSFYYSWADSKISAPSLEEDDNESFFANNDQTHIFRISQMYSVQNLTFSLNYVYKTGLPFTSNSNLVLSDEDYYELEHIQINNSRLSEYHRLDLTISGNFEWHKNQIELSASLLNVMGRNNIGSRKSILSPSSSAGEPQLIEINKNLLPRTIQFSARIFF